jgi:hypothetical protein
MIYHGNWNKTLSEDGCSADDIFILAKRIITAVDILYSSNVTR